MIKGLVPALAEGGKIKIGGLGDERTSKKGGTYRLPVKFDHFIVTRTTRGTNGDLDTDDEIMGELRRISRERDGQVREIPIVLHSDNIDEVFPTSYALYSGHKLFCRGDGETATRYEMVDGKRTGRSKEMPCTCELLGAAGKVCCKPHGILHCSIPLQRCAVAGSVYKWRTTSIISCQRMIGSLVQIQQIVGGLTGVPLVLCLKPVDVSPVNSPASTVYVCHVELRATDISEVQRRAIEARKMRAAVAGAIDYKMLISAPATDDETPEEQAEIQDEFHSEIEEENNGARPAPVRVAADLGALRAGKTEDHQGHDEAATAMSEATKAAGPREAPLAPSQASNAGPAVPKTFADEVVENVGKVVEFPDDDIPFDNGPAEAAVESEAAKAAKIKADTIAEIAATLKSIDYDLDVVPGFAEQLGLSNKCVDEYGQIELNRILDAVVNEKRNIMEKARKAELAAKERAKSKGTIDKILEKRELVRASVTPNPFPTDARWVSKINAKMFPDKFTGDLDACDEKVLGKILAEHDKLLRSVGASA